MDRTHGQRRGAWPLAPGLHCAARCPSLLLSYKKQLARCPRKWGLVHKFHQWTPGAEIGGAVTVHTLSCAACTPLSPPCLQEARSRPSVPLGGFSVEHFSREKLPPKQKIPPPVTWGAVNENAHVLHRSKHPHPHFLPARTHTAFHVSFSSTD